MNNPITTLSRERLEELASDFAMEGYATEEEEQEMARALLAVMDAKPRSDSCGGNGAVDINHGEMGIEHVECPKCLTTPPAPSAPDGWKLVPVEPTAKQWAAGLHAMNNGMDKVTLIYKAMLAAGPAPGGDDV